MVLEDVVVAFRTPIGVHDAMMLGTASWALDCDEPNKRLSSPRAFVDGERNAQKAARVRFNCRR